jgi:CheY-like chemotaxis protein
MLQFEIVIHVSDTGNGVLQEVIDRCFEPYVTTRSEGSGLGLSVCRRIVTDHDGTIELTQQIPRGCCFTIRLPILESGISKTAQDRRLQHDRRVLHIDNNTAREDMLSNLLRQLGHYVDVVRSGDEGLQQFFESNYDVVIAESGLHSTSGFEVAQVIKRRFPEIPVVLSMDASEILREDNLPVHLRPDAVLRTPASSSELETTLRELGLWKPTSGGTSVSDLH